MHAIHRSALFLLVPSTLLAAVGCTDVPMPEPADAGPQVYTPETAPSALILSPESGDTLIAGETWSLVGRVADADSSTDELRATWSYAGVALCSDVTPDAEGIVTCEASGTPGKDDITLSVVDPDGLEATASVGVTVDAAEGPSVHVDAIDTQSIYSDQPLTITGVASGEGPLSVSVRSHNDGDFEVELGDEGDFSATATLSPGDHVITVTVTDGNGATINHGTTVFVEGPNTIPNCTVLSPVSGDVTEAGTATTLTATADDADVGAAGLRVVWSSTLDGYLGEGDFDTTTGQSELAVVLSEGTHTLQFLATDEVGATCTDSVTHVVGTAPTLTLDAPTSMLDEGVADEITATVTGAASATGSAVVRWSVDGTLYDVSTTDADGIAVFDTSAIPGGAHTVVAAVRDIDGFEAAAMVEVMVNGKPSSPSVSGGGVVSSTEALVVSLDAPGIDPEGAPVTHSYTWYLNGSPTSVSTNERFPAAATVRGDVVAVAVAANDGRIDSQPTMVGFTIGNALPTASSVTISPASPTSSDSVTCSGTATDPDNDVVSASYTWLADGDPVGTGPTLAAGAARGGQQLVCIASFDDGYSASDAGSVPVYVGHSAPIIEGARFNEQAPTVETGVSIDVSAFDPDGDEFTIDYAWTINGAPAGDGPTIMGTPEAGDLVSVTVAARDAQHTSLPVTVSIAIEQAEIYAPEVSMTPEEPAEGDDLVCTIDEPAYDPDGYVLTQVVTWTRNGDVWEGATFDSDETGDSIDGAYVEAGDQWACSVVASDGSRVSDAAGASAEVGGPRATSDHVITGADLRGADDTCAADEAVVDGTLIEPDFGVGYMAASLPHGEGMVPYSVTFAFDASICNTGASSDVNLGFALVVAGDDEPLFTASETVTAAGGCTCPDGTGDSFTFEAVLDVDELELEQVELRLLTDADELGLIPSASGSYVDVTYAW